jgi:hypothetical protein
MRIVATLAVMMLVGCGAAGEDPAELPSETAQVRWMAGMDPEELSQSKTGSSPLVDHGGPVLSSSVTHAIYWGPAAGFPSDLMSGMASLLGGFNGSSYLGIAEQYMRGASLTSSYAGSILDPSAPPTHGPSTSTIGAEVCKLVPAPDPDALYIVFTSNAPKVNYCAWHDKTTCNGVTFQVAYVPNQAILSGCSPYVKANLHCNGYSNGTVASADSVAHEFMETVTDPHIDAWLDANGQEIGDKCNFNYQACVNLPTGTWQIQSEWSNAIGGCQQQ